jgi:hypothetical protein
VNVDAHPYATLAYANTLAHVGRPVHVAAWQTYVIARDWKGYAMDAIGPYPITCLAVESDLGTGLESLRKAGFVSITLVVDDLVGPPIGELQQTFGFARPFKTHYLVDEADATYQPSKHHRYEIRRAARAGVEVRVVPLLDILDAWIVLYDGLIANHRMVGVQRFSRQSFEGLADCDGLVTVAAFVGQELVSCHLWIEYKDFVWSHLAASSALGYSTGAAYAVYDQSIRTFAGRVIDLGGAAGVNDGGDDGLARFKAGFSNRQHIAYLCGAVLDKKAYLALCANSGAARSDYFPAYRAPPLT